MPKEIYEVVAQAARYWFLFLMLLIAWRSYRWLARDRRQRKRRLRLLPDAGYVGELVVLEGGGELAEGLAIPVPREGLLGCLRGADVCVPVEGVQKKHLWLYYDDKKGLTAEGFRHCRYEVDGVAPEKRRATLRHGARLRVGEALLRLRMFTGFEAMGSMTRARDFGDDEHTGDNQPQQASTLTPEQIAFIQAQWQAAQAQHNAPQQESPGIPPDAFAAYDDEAYDAPMPEPARYDADDLDDAYYPFETDEDDEPPQELYTGPDEAAHAKNAVWDRYFGTNGREG